jgi:hypothetical protein
VSQDLVDDTVAELNGQLDLPFIDEGTENEILQAAVELLLGDSDLYMMTVHAIGTTGRGALSDILDPARRSELATRLNESIDLPLLNEAQEQMVMETAIGSTGEVLDSVIPKRWVAYIQGCDKEELDELKVYVTDRIVQRVPVIPLVGGGTTAAIVTTIVGAAFDGMVLGSGIDEIVMNKEQRLAKLRELEAAVMAEKAAAERAAARRDATFSRRLCQLEDEKKALKAGR